MRLRTSPWCDASRGSRVRGGAVAEDGARWPKRTCISSTHPRSLSLRVSKHYGSGLHTQKLRQFALPINLKYLRCASRRSFSAQLRHTSEHQTSLVVSLAGVWAALSTRSLAPRATYTYYRCWITRNGELEPTTSQHLFFCLTLLPNMKTTNRAYKPPGRNPRFSDIVISYSKGVPL